MGDIEELILCVHLCVRYCRIDLVLVIKVLKQELTFLGKIMLADSMKYKVVVLKNYILIMKI